MLGAWPAGVSFDVDRRNLTRTPGRALVKSRNALQENALRDPPITVVGKGKKVVQNTPFQPKTLQTDRVLKDLPGKQVGPSKLKDTPAVRPLGDKTPFPNHTSNQLQTAGTKISKPALLEASLRPSSARKNVRLPRNASKSFETPVTGGHHWDVSDIDIEVDTAVANKSIEEEDHGEIEYIPPKVVETPYEPPFEMPNYREVGKTLMALIRSHAIEDDPPTTANVSFTVHESESDFFAVPSLPQREIEDDSPFAQVKPEHRAQAGPSRSTTQTKKIGAASRPLTRPVTRQQTSTSRTPIPTTARALSTVRRPVAATSTRPPATAMRGQASQPVARPPTSHSTVRAPISRTTTRAPSATRLTPPTRRASTAPSRGISAAALATNAGIGTSKIVGKPVSSKAAATDSTRTTASTRTLASASRPRSGTITKAAFESNSHMVVPVGNNSLEDVKKDLEGLIVFEGVFDEEEEFRFDV
ncbi:hypothetical protein PAXRUDRAFT_834019 [Paxillus rubicundulus Ve08.2h10]|uniref:Uncharacterized protein n=1 Tax=Paxillus rubicundulus Ve08.2h10 TaxID=930991 RepID=A0A0D0CVV3_9AGAM|nr:hypothetical protein PAXRUDRAFT_834019 [Paxillus rubicundulus Ve08.2h10]